MLCALQLALQLLLLLPAVQLLHLQLLLLAQQLGSWGLCLLPPALEWPTLPQTLLALLLSSMGWPVGLACAVPVL